MNSLKSFYINTLIFIGIIIFVFFSGFLIMKNLGPLTVAAEEGDDEIPPIISNIKISDISATSSIVSWETDELADSLINYSLNKNYGIVREPRFDKKQHEIVMDDLLADTTYYFRITSADASGNQGISSDHEFKTPKDKQSSITGGELKANTVEIVDELLDLVNKISSGDESEKIDDKLDDKGRGERMDVDGALGEILEKLRQIALEENLETKDIQTGKELGRLEGGEGNLEYVSLKEVLEMLQSISSEEALEVINEEVKEKAEEIVAPPTIILDYADVEVGTDYAIISWKTDKESNTIVSLAEESDYKPDAENPYIWKEGEPDLMTLDHVVQVTGLRPATTYHFQVSSKSALDLTGKSTDKTFRTKSIKPEIYNLQVVKIEEEAATIRWSTNVPCSSIIEITNLNNQDTKLEGNSSFLTAHNIRVSNLIFDTYYSALIKVESEDGEKAESDPITFITTRDKYPPEITKVNTESTIYPGSDNKIQTIVSWRTDEEASCQLFYHQGLVIMDEPLSLPKEEDYTIKHVQVVTNFLPGSVYKFWVTCEDNAKNSKKSEDFTMLTPSQEESIIDIIIKNFESSFGWVKKVGK
ncbi:MAG: hypothetical protein US83_C0008G0063 [Candidatus Falkowbacteria bacterium GW2011_GWC2_38_22]|uniref:Fibronectin type-III domain-containing protein n=1 Tax=Candidatus Falkowbacteria bacterium GW2011_GWE1_38_31 TaxID=1618638 RepID=A0A0G0K3E9_9BACT|nr:MAG: hypothetical protein US73_C0006G0059 [Candidatus Falkowbacteria bacterium GW2011_GWF2_38_1205]KKQ61222.1 MAG: hypothetical protein US83_C0008G0063 [Candidatus Falkowbacteria bacterium GW2011_GWC2_38_22]KKQ63273.1 MAG: hypothetical protein US84_C0007G0015 [Candidatus Falkowbacteria bacterium GW2011_GWF1_38_22]KKQ65609.1 MAG: hypothetical protein US87_C0006G0059 [Candidatus Falkowbacteria bacterium GW2011_GWE2_38_254]KKQ70005.1 MAG: hypothetical protein US91_C0007G0015 [Candidatus Falkowb